MNCCTLIMSDRQLIPQQSARNRKERKLTARTFNTVRYPLLWIVNQYDPGDAKAIPNKACKKIRRLLKYRDWLEERYKVSYQYELTDYLHEYGLDEPIPDFVGLRVTKTKFRDVKFYRRSWCEVYVDVIMRAYINVYTGDERSPQCRKMYVDYRVRGYYDLYERQSHLFQTFLQYRPEDDLEYEGKTPLDDYLIPVITSDNLEEEAFSCLEEIYPYIFQRSGPLNMKAVANENHLKIMLTGLSPDGMGRKARLYLFEKKGEVLYDKNGKPFTATVPANTILVERRLYYKNLLRALNSMAHEFIHFGKHSLFELAQEMYREELKEHLGISDVNSLPMDAEEQKIIRVMEWQAKRLAPRIQMYTGHVEDKMEELLHKYGWCDKHAMVERVVKELAAYFMVSREAAKYRIQELGYLRTDGDLVFIDDAYIPAYKIPEWLMPFESFDLSRKELFNAFKEDKRLRDLLHTGAFVYCESHLCLNDPLYIEKKNGRLRLTDLAHENMNECCLLFAKHRVLNYDFESGVFQDSIPEQFLKATLSGIPEKKKRWRKFVIDTRNELPANFTDIVAYYIEHFGLSTRIVADTCGLSNGTINRCSTDRNYQPKIPVVAQLTLGLGLVPGLNDHLMHRAGYSLDGNTDEEITFDILLSTMYADTIEKWDEYVRDQGLPSLFRDKKKGVK